ncbi:MAG: GTP 3',8-cyclase MoaA [Clostridia bacterium]|nr:GTP 3',8-cyclase MoaA [Clostridia bacterium]
MIDSYGREINYLRVSVTKRCNLSCTYCGAQSEKENNELTAEETEKIVRAFALCGINKVRLTGGEPLVRRDICDIAERISRIDGIRKLALTTNGIRLKEYAGSLKKAGVTAVNISLDTTDRERFRSITGYDGLHKVYEGIDECERVGLSPIRINAVLIRGQNDGDAESLISIARDRKIDVRFIELMPFSNEGDNAKLVIKSDEILEKFPFLKPAAQKGTPFEKSVARYYEGEGFKGRIGFITPISDKFCSECNRIRLLSDGKVKVCLGSDEVIDLKPYLDDESELEKAVKKAILKKPMEHKFSCGYGASHGLNKIGG